MAESAVPIMADVAVALVWRDGQPDCIELVHADRDREPGTRELVIGAGDALRRLASHRGDRLWWWVPSLSSKAFQRFVQADPAIGPLCEALGIQSLIVVPLRAGGQLHGLLALARTATVKPFTGAELAAAQVIGRRAAHAIEAAEIHDVLETAAAKRARLDQVLERWMGAFWAAGWGAAIVDAGDHRIDVANPVFAQMHGWKDPTELTGCPFTDLLPPDSADIATSWGGVGGAAVAYESTHARADGSMFPVLVNVAYVGDRRGQADDPRRVYVVTVQDLTALKRAEERLHRAQRMEAVGRLAGGVAHEVNNMMTIVLGFADILASKSLADDQIRDLDEIRKAAARAGNITRQLLAFSRQQLPQPMPLQLNDLVTDMAAVLRLMLPANIRLDTALSPIGGSVRADRAQLEQVLINLAFNARDAMSGGGTIRLATEFRHLDEETGLRLIGVPICSGSYGLLSVIDTGSGMDAATLSQIFEPFFTTKPIGQGTGLGLATVYGIVKQSGGYIWAESTIGQGTTVTVCLPEIDRPAAVSHPAEREAVPVRGSGTVLVVEDEEGVRGLASRVLRQEGYDVLEAPTGTAALKLLADSRFSIDLVLTDVVIPDVELSRVEREAHDRHGETRILFMSGYPHDDLVQRGLLDADEPFLQKPFTSTELVDRVRELLGDPNSGSGGASDGGHTEGSRVDSA